MKSRPNRFFVTPLVALAALSSSAWAADRFKQNNTTNLSLAGSWDTSPTSSDVAVFDSTYAVTGTLNTGALVTWQGIRIVNPSGQVTINNGTGGQEVALGNAGIDLTAATVNLNIQRLRVDASQTWDVPNGRVFNLGSSSGARTGVLSLGNGGPFTITKTGAGNVQLDTSNTAIGNVNWNVENGLIRAIWNGSSAWGTGTITLGGGGIASGTSFTGSVGNWTWNNNITLTSSTNSFIDNQNIAGTDRWLKLTGVISGAGNLEFRDTGTGFNNPNFGHVLTGTNTNTGTVTIATNAEVRVGATDVNSNANTGNSGKLAADSALIVNHGTLSFSRLDAHTVANDISGSGAVRIGLSATVGTATSTQIVTLSGTNTYTGATTVNNGRLNLTGSLTSAITVASGASISGNGSTTGLLTLNSGGGIALAGGSISSGLTADGATFGGSNLVTFLSNPIASTVYDVFTYGAGTVTDPGNLSVAWRGALTDDSLNQKYIFTAGASGTRTWNTTSGTWVQGVAGNWAEDDQTFYGGDAVVFNEPGSTGNVILSGRLAAGSVSVNNTTNAYTFSGTDGIADITGTSTLMKSGSGTLILNSAHTYSGATTVSGGVLEVGTGGTSGALGSGAVNVGTGAEIVFNRSNAFTVSNTLSGDGLVTKRGGGRMTVNGDNSGGTVNWNFEGTGNGDIGFQNANAIGGSGSTLTLETNATGSAFFATNGNATDVAISLESGSVFTWNGSTGNTTTLSGEISGAGSITKVSGETLRLTGVSTYTGATTISTGFLEIAGAGQLGSGSYAGNIANAATFTVNTTSNQTLSGVISGSGVLNKSNHGTLTLLETNTYTGATNVTGGTLAIGATGGLGNTTTTISLDGTLAGGGTIGGATTILGTHTPGFSPGTQTFTNGLSYGDTATLVWDLTANTTTGRGTIYDAVDVTGGSFALAAGASIDLSFGGTVDFLNTFWGTNQEWLVVDLSGTATAADPDLFTVGSITGGANWTPTLGSFGILRKDGSTTEDSVYLTWTAIPEPSTALLGGIGMLLLLRRRRHA